MSPRRTADAPRPAAGRRPASRAVRVKARRRALTAAVGLAAYLAVFVSSPAWHTHAEGGGCCDAVAATAKTACGGGETCCCADRPPADDPAPPAPVGGHDCDLCDLLAQCPLPVTPPALADAGDPLPTRPADIYENAEEAFLRTSSARGPPRA